MNKVHWKSPLSSFWFLLLMTVGLLFWVFPFRVWSKKKYHFFPVTLEVCHNMDEDAAPLFFAKSTYLSQNSDILSSSLALWPLIPTLSTEKSSCTIMTVRIGILFFCSTLIYCLGTFTTKPYLSLALSPPKHDDKMSYKPPTVPLAPLHLLWTSRTYFCLPERFEVTSLRWST